MTHRTTNTNCTHIRQVQHTLGTANKLHVHQYATRFLCHLYNAQITPPNKHAAKVLNLQCFEYVAHPSTLLQFLMHFFYV